MHTQTVPLATFHLLRIFHIRRLTPDGRGGRFNFPGQTCPDPLVALTRGVFLSVHSCGVLLKLPDISDRLFEIFFCTVPRCSPEASRYLPQTKLDFFSRYFV